MGCEMNEIEKEFSDEFNEWYDNDGLDSQVSIDNYRVDFLYDHDYIIEIDGQEFHSSKEQRENDYKRERDLLEKGYIIVRFTASEVKKNPAKCVHEFMRIYRIYERIKELGFRPKSESKENVVHIGVGLEPVLAEIFYNYAMEKGCTHCAEFVIKSMKNSTALCRISA